MVTGRGSVWDYKDADVEVDQDCQEGLERKGSLVGSGFKEVCDNIVYGCVAHVRVEGWGASRCLVYC